MFVDTAAVMEKPLAQAAGLGWQGKHTNLVSREFGPAVLASAKYRHVSPGFVRSIGVRELAIRPNLKAAIKATKNTLHQAGGAFQDAPIDYAQALARLQEPETKLRRYRAPDSLIDFLRTL